MPIDASIALGFKQPEFENPLNQLAKMMQMQGLQSQNQLAQYTMRKSEREDSDSAALRSALASGMDPAKAALSVGNLKGAADWQKGETDRLKTGAETKKLSFEASNLALTQHRSMLNNVNDPQAAKQWLAAAYQNPDLAPIFERMGPLDEAMRRFDASVTTPETFSKWKMGASMNADKLVEYTTPTANTVATNTTSRENNAANNDTSRGNNEANNARMAADAAAGRAVTTRGQNLTDARSRDTLSQSLTKPFEVTGEDGKPVLVQQDKQGNIRPVQGYQPKQGASKPLTEGQAKAALFGSRMQAAEEIFNELADKGVTTSIPGARAGYGVGTAISAMQPGERQRLDQAKRDYINAVLRRESGAVISEPEFDNAELQYFPQPGDTLAAKAQKKANRQLATRGILAEVPDSANRVKTIRAGDKPADAVQPFSDTGKETRYQDWKRKQQGGQ